MAASRLSVRPLCKGDWPAVEALFGERGACGGCWCMAWRLSNREWEANKGAANKRAFRRLVANGKAHGILALVAGEAVGWCSVDRRADYRGLETKRSLRTDWDEDTWSVTCFFIRRDWRNRGLSGKLLRAAVELARSQGARRLEGYPVVPTRQLGDKLPGPWAWTGLPQVFERQGFRALPDPPGKRPIYVRRFRTKKAAGGQP